MPRARRGLRLSWKPRAGRGRDSDRRRARAIHRWMLREPGRCGGCQAVLFKFSNGSRNRRCASCSAALKVARYAYHCQSCGCVACKQCTDASRGSSVPELVCGGCPGVLVAININRASVNRPCHSCSAGFEYLTRAYHCDSCTRIICKQCTWGLRPDDRRRRPGRRRTSPVCGIGARRGCLVGLRGPDKNPRRKRPRLPPAAGTAESEVRSTKQQRVDTASADEYERRSLESETDKTRDRQAKSVSAGHEAKHSI